MALRRFCSKENYIVEQCVLEREDRYLQQCKWSQGDEQCLFVYGSSDGVRNNLLFSIPWTDMKTYEALYLDLFTIDRVEDKNQIIWIPLNEYPLYDDYGLRLIVKFTRPENSEEQRFGIYDWLVAPNGQVYLRHPDGIYTKLIIFNEHTEEDILSHDSTFSLDIKERAIKNHMEKLYGDTIANKLCVKGDNSIKANGSKEEKKKIKKGIHQEIASEMMSYKGRLEPMKCTSHLLKFVPLIACVLLMLGVLPWNHFKLHDNNGSYALCFLGLAQFLLFMTAAGVAAITTAVVVVLFERLNKISTDQTLMMRRKPTCFNWRDIDDAVANSMRALNGEVKYIRNDLSSIFWGAQSNLGSGGKKNSGKKEKAKEILKIALFYTFNVAISVAATALAIVFTIKVMNNRPRIFEFRQSDTWIMFFINSLCAFSAICALGFGAIAVTFGLPAFVCYAKSVIKKAEIGDISDLNVRKGAEELDIQGAAIKELATTELNIQTYDQIEVPPAEQLQEKQQTPMVF